VPGTRGNIDHIVIAPAGVFVVDAKAHKGRIEIRDRGGLFRTDDRLTVGGRDCSSLTDGMGWQVEAVLTVLQDRGLDPMPVVSPVLCFLNVEWPLFRAPDSFRDVRIESERSLARVLTTSSVLTVAQADDLAALLAEGLPAK
jgi:Nuclease-related domain